MNYNGWTKADLHNNPMYSIKMCAIFRTLSFLSFLSVLPMCRKEDGTEHPQIADLFFGFLQTSYAMSRFPCCRLPFRISARSTFGRKCRFRNKYALRIINASASVDVANSRIQIKSPIKPLLKITWYNFAPLLCYTNFTALFCLLNDQYIMPFRLFLGNILYFLTLFLLLILGMLFFNWRSYWKRFCTHSWNAAYSFLTPSSPPR